MFLLLKCLCMNVGSAVVDILLLDMDLILLCIWSECWKVSEMNTIYAKTWFNILVLVASLVEVEVKWWLMQHSICVGVLSTILSTLRTSPTKDNVASFYFQLLTGMMPLVYQKENEEHVGQKKIWPSWTGMPLRVTSHPHHRFYKSCLKWIN